MSKMNSHQKIINIDLATRVNEDAIKRSEKTINDFIRKAEETPVRIKIDDTQIKAVIKELSSLYNILDDTFKDVLGLSKTRNVAGFKGLRESIVDTLKVLEKFETALRFDSKNTFAVQTEVTGFEQLLNLIQKTEEETNAFGETTKKTVTGILPTLQAIQKTLDNIATKIKVENLRPIEKATEDYNLWNNELQKSDTLLTDYRKNLLNTFNGTATKETTKLKNQIKEITAYLNGAGNANVERAFKGTLDAGTGGVGKFATYLSAALALPEDQLDKIKIKVGDTTKTLRELGETKVLEKLAGQLKKPLTEVETYTNRIQNLKVAKRDLQKELNKKLDAGDIKFGGEDHKAIEAKIKGITEKIVELQGKIKDRKYEVNLGEKFGANIINGFQEANQEADKFNQEMKDIEAYTSRGFSIDRSSINALKEAIASIGTINASIGEGAVLGFNPEQIEEITGAFQGLEKVVQEIANILRTTFNTPPNGLEETTKELNEVTWAYTRLTGTIGQPKKNDTTGPAFGINQDQVQSIISSLETLITKLGELHTSLQSVGKDSSLSGISKNIDALSKSFATFKQTGSKSATASFSAKQINEVTKAFNDLKKVIEEIRDHVKEFDFLNMGKSFSATQQKQIRSLIQEILDDTSKIESKSEDLKAKVESTAETAVQEVQKVEEEVKKTYQLFEQSNGQMSLFNDVELEETRNQFVRIGEAADEARAAVERVNSAKQDIPGQQHIFDYIGDPAKKQIEGQIDLTEALIQKQKELEAQQSAKATVRWILDVNREYKLAGEEADAFKERIKQAAEATANADGGYGLEVLTSAFEEQDRITKKVAQDLENAKNALVAFSEAGNDISSKEGLQLAENLKKAQREYDKLNNVEKYRKEQLKEIEAEQKKVAKETEADINRQIKAVETLINKLKNSGRANLLGEDFTFFIDRFSNFKDEIGTFSADNAKATLKEFVTEIEQLSNTAKQAAENIKALASEGAINSQLSKMNTFLRVNKKLAPETRQQVQALINSLKVGKTTSTELDNVAKSFANIAREAKAAGETGNTWTQGWKKRLTALTQYLATFASFYRIIGYIREAITTIKDLDYALVDLKKTTTMTKVELESFYSTAADTAKELGVTTKEIIDQAAAWSRLGYSSKEAATEMSKLSSQFAQISPGMDVEKSTDGLVSAMKAFHTEIDDVERSIMDNVNRIGRRKLPKHTVMYGATILII